MATPDVSVHMEEVVVVTTPDTAVDGSGVEEVKTVLVTTNLAPHGGDLTEDNMETENAAAAAAAAFTASSQLKEAVLVKMAEEEENLEAEIVYPITCGDSRANLIWRKFVCPGINVKCVQEDHGLRGARLLPARQGLLQHLPQHQDRPLGSPRVPQQPHVSRVHPAHACHG
uniref:Glucocorticoid modulatory element binding protein 2 n=1 Tax=Equus caballus TaxID=9796 RepID=A0A9L0RW37_HORSE